jgi:glutamine synthetase
MGMAQAQLALDPTDAFLNLPGVTDEQGKFADEPLRLDPQTVRRLPWSKPGHDLLVLSNWTRAAGALCPRAILPRCWSAWAPRGSPEIRDGAGIHPVR